MAFENNDKVFTILKTGRLSFGRVKLAREKVTKIPADSSTFHCYQIIWDDYRKMWQWLEDVETPLVVYDRDFEVGDKVTYGNGLTGTVRNVFETATLLTDSETVIDSVKIKDIEYLTTIYPSAKIEYQGCLGEVISVTRETLCQCHDGVQFIIQSNEPEIISPKKKKKKAKISELSKSRVAKFRVYPFHQENLRYFPGNQAIFSRKELKRAKWIKRSCSQIKSFKDYTKYIRKSVSIKSVTITKIEVFWKGYIPFLLESADKLSQINPIITGPDVANVHPLKPNELSWIDCKDFINFGHGSYFQYFPKESDVQMELENWEFQFKSKFAQIPSEFSTENLDHNKNKTCASSGDHLKQSCNAIRVKKIMSSRCYEVNCWLSDSPAVIIPGWKLASDTKYCKISTFKMGFPFITKKFLFPDYEKLGIVFHKYNPDVDDPKSVGVVWTKITPAGDIIVSDIGRESPYDLTYCVPPCLTTVGSILYNPGEDTKFKYGIITHFDILEFGKVRLYDPIRGHSVRNINNLRSVHRLDSKRNCTFWTSQSIFRRDTTIDIGESNYNNRSFQNAAVLLANSDEYEICDVGNGGKYYELAEVPTGHHYYYEALIDEVFDDKKWKSKWDARVELEKQKFAAELPEGIWICGYKNREDLLTVIIEGNAGSILEDTLIIVEMRIRSSFPKMSMYGMPYQISFGNIQGTLLMPHKCISEFIPDQNCDISSSYMTSWKILSTWDPATSTLFELITSIKENFHLQITKFVAEPARMEINYNGLQTEYAIWQKYNFQLAIDALDSICTSISYPLNKHPWLYYFVRKYYSQAVIRIRNRYKKWILIDKEWLQENPDSKEIPTFQFLPFSKDFASSVQDRLAYFQQIFVEGKRFHETSLYKGYNRDRGYRDLAEGILEYRTPSKLTTKEIFSAVKASTSADSSVKTTGSGTVESKSSSAFV